MNCISAEPRYKSPYKNSTGTIIESEYKAELKKKKRFPSRSPKLHTPDLDTFIAGHLVYMVQRIWSSCDLEVW